MWEIFKSKERKEREANEQIALKRLYQDTVKILEGKINNEYHKRKSSDIEFANRINNKCPKCEYEFIIDKISQIKGDINGSINGYSSLFGGNVSGSVHGSIDTLEINKCPKCNHEWKKYKPNGYFESTDDKINQLVWLLSSNNDYKNCKFDNKDINEKYNSFQEKKDDLLDKLNKSIWMEKCNEFWSGTSIKVIKLIVENKSYHSYYREKFNEYYDEDFLINKVGFLK